MFNEPTVDSGDSPLGSRLLVTADKFLGVLLDGVVGEVHKDVADVARGGFPVGLRGETCQAILEDEDPHRHDRSDQHVEPQVELVAVYEKGL